MNWTWGAQTSWKETGHTHTAQIESTSPRFSKVIMATRKEKKKKIQGRVVSTLRARARQTSGKKKKGYMKIFIFNEAFVILKRNIYFNAMETNYLWKIPISIGSNPLAMAPELSYTPIWKPYQHHRPSHTGRRIHFALIKSNFLIFNINGELMLKVKETVMDSYQSKSDKRGSLKMPFSVFMPQVALKGRNMIWGRTLQICQANDGAGVYTHKSRLYTPQGYVPFVKSSTSQIHVHLLTWEKYIPVSRKEMDTVSQTLSQDNWSIVKVLMIKLLWFDLEIVYYSIILYHKKKNSRLVWWVGRVSAQQEL